MEELAFAGIEMQPNRAGEEVAAFANTLVRC
jgi:hypothetical protein